MKHLSFNNDKFWNRITAILIAVVLFFIFSALTGCENPDEPITSDQINYSKITLALGTVGDFGFLGGEKSLRRIQIRYDGHINGWGIPVLTYPDERGNMKQNVVYSNFLYPYGRELLVRYTFVDNDMKLEIQIIPVMKAEK